MKKNMESVGQYDDKSIYARIENKNQTLSRIAAIKRELSAVSNRCFMHEASIRELTNEIKGISLDRLGAPERRQGLEADKADYRAKLEQSKQISQNLKDELHHLETVVLPGCLKETTFDQVRQHQDGIASLRAEAGIIETAIEGQRKVIQQAEASIHQMTDRSGQRATLLADIAIDAALPDSLDSLDAEIASDRKAHDDSKKLAEPVINQARQCISGLESKLAHVNSKIDQANTLSSDVMEQYLSTEINIVASRYVSNALAVKEDFLRLTALENLLNGVAAKAVALGTPKCIINRDIALPLPLLDICKDEQIKSHPGLLFGTLAGVEVNYSAFEQSELARLRKEGCELL